MKNIFRQTHRESRMRESDEGRNVQKMEGWNDEHIFSFCDSFDSSIPFIFQLLPLLIIKSSLQLLLESNFLSLFLSSLPFFPSVFFLSFFSTVFFPSFWVLSSSFRFWVLSSFLSFLSTVFFLSFLSYFQSTCSASQKKEEKKMKCPTKWSERRKWTIELFTILKEGRITIRGVEGNLSKEWMDLLSYSSWILDHLILFLFTFSPSILSRNERGPSLSWYCSKLEWLKNRGSFTWATFELWYLRTDRTPLWLSQLFFVQLLCGSLDTTCGETPCVDTTRDDDTTWVWWWPLSSWSREPENTWSGSGSSRYNFFCKWCETWYQRLRPRTN